MYMCVCVCVCMRVCECQHGVCVFVCVSMCVFACACDMTFVFLSFVMHVNSPRKCIGPYTCRCMFQFMITITGLKEKLRDKFDANFIKNTSHVSRDVRMSFEQCPQCKDDIMLSK